MKVLGRHSLKPQSCVIYSEFDTSVTGHFTSLFSLQSSELPRQGDHT